MLSNAAFLRILISQNEKKTFFCNLASINKEKRKIYNSFNKLMWLSRYLAFFKHFTESALIQKITFHSNIEINFNFICQLLWWPVIVFSHKSENKTIRHERMNDETNKRNWWKWRKMQIILMSNSRIHNNETKKKNGLMNKKQNKTIEMNSIWFARQVQRQM